MVSKIVMGIDPGSHHLGVGCVVCSNDLLTLRHADVIHAPKKEPLYARLKYIMARLGEIVDKLTPDEIAIEDVFFAKNARSAFHLGMAKGVVVAMCLSRGIHIYEYTPTKVKSAVTGFGRADKGQVQKMIRIILGQKVPTDLDATDALAVAICHANHCRNAIGRKSYDWPA